MNNQIVLDCGCRLEYDEALEGSPADWNSWRWTAYGRECDHISTAQVFEVYKNSSRRE